MKQGSRNISFKARHPVHLIFSIPKHTYPSTWYDYLTHHPVVPPSLTSPLKAQTPQQKRANQKYANVNEKRMGKPETSYRKKDVAKSPVNKIIVGQLPLSPLSL